VQLEPEFLVGVVLDDGDVVDICGIVVKIVSLKNSAQRIVCYFIADTWALVE
jgi:hypothetical protein